MLMWYRSKLCKYTGHARLVHSAVIVVKHVCKIRCTVGASDKLAAEKSVKILNPDTVNDVIGRVVRKI